MYYIKKLNKYPLMKKYKFLRISKTKKLRYINNYSKKKLIIIKNGDHSLSDVNSLKKIKNELSIIIKNIF